MPFVGWVSEPRVSKLTLEVPPFVQSEMQKRRTKRFFSRTGERVQEPRRGLSATLCVKKSDAVEEGCSGTIRRVGFEPRVSKLTLEVPPFVQSEMQKRRTKGFFSRTGESVQEPRRGCSPILRQKRIQDPEGSWILLRKGWDSNPRSVISRTHDFQSCALDQLSHLCVCCVYDPFGVGTHSLVCHPGVLPGPLRYYIITNGVCQAFGEKFFAPFPGFLYKSQAKTSKRF